VQSGLREFSCPVPHILLYLDRGAVGFATIALVAARCRLVGRLKQLLKEQERGEMPYLLMQGREPLSPKQMCERLLTLP
jgi:hypothetical protein